MKCKAAFLIESRKILAGLFIILFAFLAFPKQAFSQTTFFIKYKDSVPLSQMQSDIQQKKIISTAAIPSERVESFFFSPLFPAISDARLSRIIKVIAPVTLSADQFASIQAGSESIEYVQPNVTYSLDFTPNDSLFAQQWAMKKIEAEKAWNISIGDSTVLVCVIDTGIDYLHPDLRKQIFINPGEIGLDSQGNEKRSNNIDDDGNGFTDDFRGWDFCDRTGFPFDPLGNDYLFWDNNPMDEHNFSHGTSVAGIIGATYDNITGIAGVAPGVRILNLRAFDPEGYGEEDDVSSAILYAVKMGARVINMSFGDYSYSYVLKDVIAYAYSQGVVLVASSGNSASLEPHYPSGYSEVISVGNTTIQDYVASTSNFGSTLDLVAPGTDILTTIRNGRYLNFNGTSAAAPFISGAAALLLSKADFSNEEIKQILKSTSDDIDAPGWDERSGAGRLNLFKALSILSPAEIRFISPLQDYAVSGNSLTIVATLLSPSFRKMDLYYGSGTNPEHWTPIVENKQNQFREDTLAVLDISVLPDSVYTLRMLVTLIDGRTTEERVNFHVLRNAPQAELISLIPAYLGDIPTIIASVYSSSPSIIRMYFRKLGDSEFRFVTLDGLATNNQFVKQLHYGFLPQEFTLNSTPYEIYFEAENIAGLKSYIRDGSGVNFFVTTDSEFKLTNNTKKPYSLPPGYIFDSGLDFNNDGNTEILLRDFSLSEYTFTYSYQDGVLLKNSSDSLYQQIVKGTGDFNNNGKQDLLTLWGYSTQFLEQDESDPLKFLQKENYDTSFFWPIMVNDIDNDGSKELLVLRSTSILSVYSINSDFSLKHETSVKNTTPAGFGTNEFSSPAALVLDTDGDGLNEIWMMDNDGDLMQFIVRSKSVLEPGKLLRTEYLSSSQYIAKGDFNGDNKTDMAVLLQSYEEIDVAPYHRLIIFTPENNGFVTLFDHAFLNTAAEFRDAFRKPYNSMKFADINNDGKDEVLLIAFPYYYAFNYTANGIDVIAYDENINSNSLLAYDIDSNGVLDVALPGTSGIAFYEYGEAKSPNTPIIRKAYSLDSLNVFIEWQGTGDYYYVYRGLDKDNLNLIDSTNLLAYYDSNVSTNTEYFYSVKAYQSGKEISVSGFSRIAAVFHHKPASMLEVLSVSKNSIEIVFDEKINKTIYDLHSFELLNEELTPGTLYSEYPHSMTVASENSYLVTFSDEIPGGNNKIAIHWLIDEYGSPVSIDTVSFYHVPPVTEDELFIDVFTLLDPYTLKITFNLDVDPVSAVVKENYVFSPENGVNSIALDSDDRRTVYVSVKNGKPMGSVGIEYLLTISGLLSSTETGSVPITSGAGSVVLVTANASDLSDVYVYPSPGIIAGGSGTITFANLPRFAEIAVFKITGERVTHFREEDGNGGYTWNLRDENGETIASGIYLFYIEQKDEAGNIKDKKVLKFAVVQ